jgi:hypothetical protein
MKEKATTGVDFHQMTENLALWIVLNPQRSVATVTQGKNDTVLETPKFQTQERSYAFPTWLG